MQQQNAPITSWLSPELREKCQKVFAPRYGRQLSDDEITEIACNLADFAEIYLKFKWRTECDPTAKIKS